MRFCKAVFWVVLAVLILGIPASSQAQVAVGISVHVGPPALPVYEQPVIPGPGYLWTPGYWAYGPGGYYWVPGAWVEPPTVGLLWTPGYWGWAGGVYVWHGGYWGPHVGFYGGINYGYGYTGVGFAGGYWRGREFYYNRSVAHLNERIAAEHSYERAVAHAEANRTSFNGGRGGIQSRPSTAELAAEREHHVQATSLQTQHEHMASTNKAMFASNNHGQPSIAATSKAGEFKGSGVVAARPANSPQPGANQGAVKSNASGFGNQPNTRTSTPATANANTPKTTTQPSYGGHAQQQPSYGGHPQQQPSYGGHPAQSQPGNQQGQGQQQHQAQPQQHQAQPQEHQQQQHQGEGGGKPHKPRG